MNQGVIKSVFALANDEDYLKIDFGTKCLEIPKRFLKYGFINQGTYIEIQNTGKKELYLIKTDSIDLITLIKPKFKGMTWWSGREETKAGA